ncbi:LHFPL tetraspan subfamily member 2 protein-like [Rhipicephalus microplus]|uniref:LHFPL tetraspan subfamily member 2 protein-like n=1 Tax=Rhipicephalus microplus TaxID=6941 RepID=UPI003F6C55B0
MIIRKGNKPHTPEDFGPIVDDIAHRLCAVHPTLCPPDEVGAALYLAPPHVHVLRYKTSWPVSLAWTLLSTLVALMSIVSLVQPEWLVRERTDVYRPPLTYDPDDLAYMLGLYGACYRDTDDHNPGSLAARGDALCFRFDDAPPGHEEPHVGARFPSATWRAGFLLFSSGSAVLCIGAVLAILSLAMHGTANRVAAAAVIGHAQTAGVILQATALLLFPWFLATAFAQAHCGDDSGAFSLGHCRLGWASVLAGVSTLLGLYCPVLVRFVSYPVYAPCAWNVL